MSNVASLFFYIILFTSLVGLMGLYDYNYNKKHKKICNIIFLIAFIVLTFVSGFRYYVGTDYANYIKYYHSYSFLEIGDRVLFQIANMISAEPQTIIFIYSFLTNLLVMLAIKKLGKKNGTMLIFASYLFIYLPFSYNIIRQGLSMALALYALAFLQNNQKKQTILLLFLSFLIHNSTIILFPYFLVAMFSKKTEKISKKLILVTFATLIILFLGSPILSRFSIFNNYKGYFLKISFSNIDYNFILAYFPFLVLLFLFKKSISESTLLKNYCSIFFTGFLFEFLLSSSDISRIALYFSLIQIVLFPLLLNKIKDKFSRKIVKIIYYCCLILYFIYVFYIYGRAEIFPYNNTFFI